MVALEFTWFVVRKKPGLVPGTIKRLPVLIVLFVLFEFLVVSTSKNQKLMASEDLIFILSLLNLFAIGLIAFIWHIIIHSTAADITDYKLNTSGIAIGDKKIYPLDNFDQETITSTLTPLILPYEQWSRDPLPEDKFLKLQLKSKNGNIDLFFSDEHARQQFIRSFQEHLNPEPITPVV